MTYCSLCSTRNSVCRSILSSESYVARVHRMQAEPTGHTTNGYYQTAPTTPSKKTVSRTPSAKLHSYSNQQSPAITNTSITYINQRATSACTAENVKKGGNGTNGTKNTKRRNNLDDANDAKRSEQIKGTCLT